MSQGGGKGESAWGQVLKFSPPLGRARCGESWGGQSRNRPRRLPMAEQETWRKGQSWQPLKGQCALWAVRANER
jgi:hypothetical protein